MYGWIIPLTLGLVLGYHAESVSNLVAVIVGYAIMAGLLELVRGD